MKKNISIDNYISNFPIEIQTLLQNLRKVIKKKASEAEEKISYGIPTFDLNGKHLVHIGAFKNHISIFPTPSAINHFNDELKNYKTSKGAIQFSLDKDLPFELIEKIVDFRIKEIN